MLWICRLSKQAAKEFRDFPQARQRQLARAIDEMERDPLAGDVRPIKSGLFKGILRKRVGPYRIIFTVNESQREIRIAAILTRSEHTYQ